MTKSHQEKSAAPALAMSEAAAIILAAGKGTRLRSVLPKVLHQVAGRPMLGWVTQVLKAAGFAEQCVVLSEDLGDFKSFLAREAGLRVAIQQNRLGTGDAVAATAWSFAGAQPASYAKGYALAGQGPASLITSRFVLIAAGDVPGMRSSELAAFMTAFQQSGAAVGVLGMRVPDPRGYGRLVLGHNDELLEIVEEKDASPDVKRLDICNTGVMAVETATLFRLLQVLTPNNAQSEYYLTDIVRHARRQNQRAMAYLAAEHRDYAGVNDRQQLNEVETWLLKRLRQGLMASGVTLRLPETIYIEADVGVEADTEIGPGCRLAGRTHVGAGSRLGSHAVVTDCRIGAGARIGDGAVLEGCIIAEGTVVPPLTVRVNS